MIQKATKAECIGGILAQAFWKAIQNYVSKILKDVYTLDIRVLIFTDLNLKNNLKCE